MARAGGVKSMTGFGAATVAIAAGRLTIEVRSVNQRFLDVRVTAPREYAAWEATCREMVRAKVARGRVEVYVGRNAPAATRTKVVLNVAAAREHAAAWRRLTREIGLTADLEPALFRTPEIFQTIELPSDPGPELAAASRALTQALARFDTARRREGANLARDMRARVERLAGIERTIRSEAGGLRDEIQTRLTERMEALLKGATVDAARIAQEAAYLAERSDVTEEMVRLASHLSALRACLGARQPVGKQIEFLLQETHREINTIGSKVNNLEITRLVVEAKGEVERLREQVQNVE